MDESYALGGGARSIYLLAAVVLERQGTEAVRQQLRSEFGTAQFHATDLFRAGDLDSLRWALRHVQDDAVATVVTVRMPVAQHPDEVRKACLRALAVRLHRGGVDTLVADARRQLNSSNPQVENKKDLATIQELKTQQLLPGAFQMVHNSVTELLWLADVVAWSVRRSELAVSPSLLDVLATTPEVIRLNSLGKPAR